MKRAAVCVGVDRARGMTPLHAAVTGARAFETWARSQGCDTTLLVDDSKTKVTVGDIFSAIEKYLDPPAYDQLIAYFSGHGILQAPGAEYWLLSEAPRNPNEAVNLSRSIEEARNAGIPHVVFVSDACRSSVSGPPLSGVTGGVIFPGSGYRQQRAEVDVFYATRPGDPAYEAPEAEATKGYRGLFTDNLLRAVGSPRDEWVEVVTDAVGDVRVVTSRKLKPFLETVVQEDAGAIDIRFRQEPEVRVETALPKFFALVSHEAAGTPPVDRPPSLLEVESRPVGASLSREARRRWNFFGRRTRTLRGGAPRLAALRRVIPYRPKLHERRHLPREPRVRSVSDEVESLLAVQESPDFEGRTGFTVYGAALEGFYAREWRPDVFSQPDPSQSHVALEPESANAPRAAASIVLQFDGGRGAVLPILPGFVGTVVVNGGRTESANYVPSSYTDRYDAYRARAPELERLKAHAAVASRHGRIDFNQLDAAELAGRIRQEKGIDPTMGIYAAYGYAQAGRYDEAYDVYGYMRDDLYGFMQDEIQMPVPFDVVMLASRYEPHVVAESEARIAPFAPLLTQGWSLLMPGDPLHRPLHLELRPHLIPSLWTTFDARGVDLIRRLIANGDVR